MELMDIRRLLMTIGGGNMAKSKSGTFTGDGTKNVNLQIGFEPDVILIECGLDATVAGNTGLYIVCIAKNVFTVNISHNSNTDVQMRTMVGDMHNKGWGWLDSSIGSYRSNAQYADGVLMVSNVTASPGAQYWYINGQSYTWTAYKA